MKKIIVLSLLTLMLFSGVALANEATMEVTGGEVNFEVDLLGRQMDGGSGWLEAEFTGQFFDEFDWKLRLDDGTPRLSLSKEIGNMGVGVGRRADTYIKYGLNDELDLTFIPNYGTFSAGGILATTSLTSASSKIEADYKLSEEMDLSGAFWTGNLNNAREILIKSGLDYEIEDEMFYSIDALLDLNIGEFRSGRKTNYNMYDIPAESFVVNARGGLKLDDSLTVNGEAKLGLGSYKSETWDSMIPGGVSDLKASRLHFGLYARGTKELDDGIEVYASYRLERISSKAEGESGADEHERLVKILKQGIEVGGEMPLEEDGFSLYARLSLEPESLKVEDDGVVTDDPDTTFNPRVIIGIKYKF